jgi:hypothetical protein
MNQAGYGRGYYGDNQLAKAPPRRGGGWLKIALVVGAGGVAWIIWRRRAARTAQLAEFGLVAGQPISAQVLSSPEWQLAQPQLAQPQLAQPQLAQPQLAQPQLAQPQLVPAPYPAPSAPPVLTEPQVHHAQVAQQLIQSRVYPSMRAYEDAIVASARQLQDSGAEVVLAPHLAHLAPRLGS